VNVVGRLAAIVAGATVNRAATGRDEARSSSPYSVPPLDEGASAPPLAAAGAAGSMSAHSTNTRRRIAGQCRGRAGCTPPLHAFVRETARVLHVTNGDSAVQSLRAAGVPGDLLAWRDVLHEGPVREGLDQTQLRAERARFLAARRWAKESDALADMTARDERLQAALDEAEEVVLWFESDLYDALQLAQILDRIPPGRARLVLVGVEEFVGVAELSEEDLRDHLDAAPLLTEHDMTAARKLWAAFRAPDPRGLEALQNGTVFGEAARRHLQQFPWRGSGLNRTERALLRAIVDGQTVTEAFLAQQRLEERPFLGDRIAFHYLAELPLGFDLLPTDEARAIIAGEREWTGRPERWLGGVRLPPGKSPWLYDPATGRTAYEPS
jgi:hypothetical protein